MSTNQTRVPSIPRPPPSPLRTPSGSTLVPNESSSSSASTATPAQGAAGATVPRPRKNTLTASGPGSTVTPAAQQKPRARDLLRKHYGLGVGPPPPKPGNTQDPMDLNSTAFDAKSYYEQLITTSTLPALLKRENELLSEIRQLDSDRQSLVYNHHHELIAASDTISAMKTRAESLDGDLDLLRAAFSEISRLTAEVSTEHEN